MKSGIVLMVVTQVIVCVKTINGEFEAFKFFILNHILTLTVVLFVNVFVFFPMNVALLSVLEP